MKKKTLALLLSLVLVIGVAAGGTLAWLLDSTAPVVNTFTDSDIDIELGETTTDFKMIPGWTIAKDPKVTVKANSEDCFLFVKIDKSTNYDTYLADYVVASGWTQGEGEGEGKDGIPANVYYRQVTTSTSDQSFFVLKGAAHKTDCEQGEDCECPNLNGYVTVKEGVTKEQMNALSAETDPAPKPTLTFTAYATQKWQSNSTAFTPYEAWTKVAPAAPAPTPSGP